MNAKSLIAASTLALLGTTAFAWEAPELETPSTLSRAEVRAELIRARNAGEIAPSAEPYDAVDAELTATKAAGRSRAEVVNELAAIGPSEANEAYGTVVIGDSTRSRAQVQAEAAGRSVNQRLYSGE